MAIRLPTASRNAAADAVVDRIDGGSGAGTVQIRTGTQPASATDAASGTLLATFTLADPAFGAAATGTATLDADPVLTTTGVAAGDAGWFRVLDSDSATVYDGSITATGGGGDLTMATIAVSVGLEVRITGGTYTQPAG
jgi:hypothetical protein